MSFNGKVAIVTGASSGIGAATAVHFAKEGAKVVAVGRNQENLEKVAADCRVVGEKPLVITADITKNEEATNIVKETIEVYGRLDILVNNAGIWKLTPVTKERIDEVFDEVMNVNLKAAIILTNVAIPFLVKTKGNIVNVSSIMGKKVFNHYSIYSASKAALSHFSRIAASELAPNGVRVNIVSPGPVETNLFNEDVDIGSMDELKLVTALDKLAKPEEVADLIAYVASDKAACVTGSEFVIDCGTY